MYDSRHKTKAWQLYTAEAVASQTVVILSIANNLCLKISLSLSWTATLFEVFLSAPKALLRGLMRVGLTAGI
jgi:hypothetical protein